MWYPGSVLRRLGALWAGVGNILGRVRLALAVLGAALDTLESPSCFFPRGQTDQDPPGFFHPGLGNRCPWFFAPRAGDPRVFAPRPGETIPPGTPPRVFPPRRGEPNRVFPPRSREPGCPWEGLGRATLPPSDTTWKRTMRGRARCDKAFPRNDAKTNAKRKAQRMISLTRRQVGGFLRLGPNIHKS